MGVFVSALVRNCLQCQKAKVHRHVSLQAAHIPIPVRRFSLIHVDLVGPLPSSSGFLYLFTVVDRTTRWPEAIPLTSTTAADRQPPSYRGGSRGSEFQTSSLATGVCSSPLRCGPAFVLFSPSRTLRLLPIILNPRPCGALPPPSEGCPTSQSGRSGLVFTPSLGNVGCQSSLERGLGIFPIRGCFWFTVGFAWSDSFCTRVAVADLPSRLLRRLGWPPPLFRQPTTLHHHPQPFQRICFCLVMCWSAMTPSSCRCRRCTMVRSWLLRGLYIFSKSRWVPRSILFLHIASSLVTLLKKYRPPNRRAEVVRRTPSSQLLYASLRCQFHASLLAFQPRFHHQLRNVADEVHSPANWSLSVRRHPSAARHQVRPPCSCHNQADTLHSLEPTYRVVKMRKVENG
jgi:hypothetical protein